MFEKKATSEDLLSLEQSIDNRFYRMQAEQQRMVDELTDSVNQAERRLVRYSQRLTSLINELGNLTNIVNHNAEEGQKGVNVLREAYERMAELKTAIELVATEIGTKIEVLPEIPTTVTIQPGLPERLGLETLTKAEKRSANNLKGTSIRDSQPLPAPIELSAGEMTRGLSLVRQ